MLYNIIVNYLWGMGFLQRVLIVFSLMLLPLYLSGQSKYRVSYYKEKPTLLDGAGDTVIPYGRYSSIFEPDSEGYVIVKGEDAYGVVHLNGDTIIPFRYENFYFFNNNRGLVKREGKYGYVDRSGHEVIPLLYDQGHSFTKFNTAVVAKKKRYGTIDTLGKNIIPFSYSNIMAGPNEPIVAVENKKKWAFFDELSGKQLTPFEYDFVQYAYEKNANNNNLYESRQFFKFGVNRFSINGAFGIMDSNFNEVVQFGRYDSISVINVEGVFVVFQGDSVNLLNKNGEILLPKWYSRISNPKYRWNQPFLSFLAEDSNEVVVISPNGVAVFAEPFDSVQILSNHFFRAFRDGEATIISDKGKVVLEMYNDAILVGQRFIVEENGKFGLVDFDNNIIIPVSYDSVFKIGSEYAVLRDGEIGLFSKDGKMLIPFSYSHIFYAWSDGPSEFIVCKDGLCGLIDKEYNELTPMTYDGISSWIEYGPPGHYIKKDGKYGYIESDGKEVIPPIYDDISLIHGFFVLQSDEYFGLMTKSGEWVFPLEYDYIFVLGNFWGFENESEVILLKSGDLWNAYDYSANLIDENIQQSIIMEKYSISDIDIEEIEKYRKVKNLLDWYLEFPD